MIALHGGPPLVGALRPGCLAVTQAFASVRRIAKSHQTRRGDSRICDIAMRPPRYEIKDVAFLRCLMGRDGSGRFRGRPRLLSVAGPQARDRDWGVVELFGE